MECKCRFGRFKEESPLEELRKPVEPSREHNLMVFGSLIDFLGFRVFVIS